MACEHCGTDSKIHPVNARYCEAYETNKIEQLEGLIRRLLEDSDQHGGVPSYAIMDEIRLWHRGVAR